MTATSPGTLARVLALLDLLQSRPVWSGTELAERLGVTTRSIRRDIDRLRELGYPVNATHGAAGGYQLGAGRRLPPLLLADDEAVAIAVCLRLAAGGTIEGLGEAAVRTLTKLDQILPARLRAEVDAIHRATVTLDGAVSSVDAQTLLALARAVRATERVSFGYTAPNRSSNRRAEPYRLVATGRRWYLLAYDLDRQDWRTFRLDRISAVTTNGWRFRPRDSPDAAEFVRRAISVSPYDHVARVLIDAPQQTVASTLPVSVGTVTAHGREKCVLEVGGNDLETMALHLARLPWQITVLDPPALRAVMRAQAQRLLRSAGHESASPRGSSPDPTTTRSAR